MTTTTKLPPPPTLVISGTSSGVGKTTVAVGLMAALARRGLAVQPFKVGPDFLDGMHHEAACAAAVAVPATMSGTPPPPGRPRRRRPDPKKCVNLDDWMMGSVQAVQESFLRHSAGADVCIVEGCMGLFDGRDGASDAGSTAAVSKCLRAPVVLVVDASMMARSIAAMVLGYSSLDCDLSLAAVVANKVGSKNHLHWIRQAMEPFSALKDNLTQKPVLLAGGLPRDEQVSIPSRHLGLHMPTDGYNNSSWVDQLADLIEEHLDVDALLELAQSQRRDFEAMRGTVAVPTSSSSLQCNDSKRCRIGIAQDEAFCFYYQDNLHYLRQAGAVLIPFSPMHSKHLPPFLDGIYLGGGYPELYAQALQDNQQLRRDIKGFVQAGCALLAECGGLMYLADSIITGTHVATATEAQENTTNGSNTQTPVSFEMCGVFPNKVIRMTRHMKMFYAQMEFTECHPLFQSKGTFCRGQKFHFSELIDLDTRGTKGDDPSMLVHPQTPDASRAGDPLSEEGHTYKNAFASYYHLHFASHPALAEQFVKTAVQNAPYKVFTAVSFVSAATEIVFALGMEELLGGVSSVCDAPSHAKDAPRIVISHSSISMRESSTSEEIAAEMARLRDEQQQKPDTGRPGHWVVDRDALRKIAPRIAFVQNSCDICDPGEDDALAALQDANLLHQQSPVHEQSDNSGCQVVQVSPTSLEGIFDSIKRVAAVLHVEAKGVNFVSELQKRLSHIRSTILSANRCSSTSPKTGPLRVVSLEGLAPLCTGGGWLPDMKRAAGCEDAFGETGGAKPRVRTWDEIFAVDPDVLILSPCSATTARTFRELHLVASEPLFWKLRCLHEGKVYILDHSRFSRPGPMVVEGIEMLAVLLRGLPLPRKSLNNEWKGQAYKYQYVGDENDDLSLSAAELQGRFAPCFGDPDGFIQPFEEAASLTSESSLQKHGPVRYTSPGQGLLSDRSAHNLVSAYVKGKPAILMFGGENKQAQRNSDVWLLTASEEAWRDLSTLHESGAILERPTWEYVTCSSIADENVPTKRSNAAAVVCGQHLLIFGGWGEDNTTPLSHCELLHLDTFCWTHCSTRNDVEPPPRGNPTLVYSEKKHCVILFGGWNGRHRYNDLWCLDMNQWAWTKIEPKGTWPKPRTDHTAALWAERASEEWMLVFGGSMDGAGPCNELWSLDCSSEDQNAWTWKHLESDDTSPCPAPRTSHAMTLIGSGSSASILVSGGNSSGAGKSAIVGDAWAWNVEEKWIRLGWKGAGTERCRHGMAAVESTIVIWGGYDGFKTVSECLSWWTAQYDANQCFAAKEPESSRARTEKCKDRRIQERWESEIPMRIADVPSDILEKAKKSKVPGALCKALHRYAVANNRDTYIDPQSGYSVFTQLYLKRQPCCGNGCRHCPWGHQNVPKDASAVKNDVLDW